MQNRSKVSLFAKGEIEEIQQNPYLTKQEKGREILRILFIFKNLNISSYLLLLSALIKGGKNL